jgi:hypothetical protein
MATDDWSIFLVSSEPTGLGGLDDHPAVRLGTFDDLPMAFATGVKGWPPIERVPLDSDDGAELAKRFSALGGEAFYASSADLGSVFLVTAEVQGVHIPGLLKASSELGARFVINMDDE